MSNVVTNIVIDAIPQIIEYELLQIKRNSVFFRVNTPDEEELENRKEELVEQFDTLKNTILGDSDVSIWRKWVCVRSVYEKIKEFSAQYDILPTTDDVLGDEILQKDARYTKRRAFTELIKLRKLFNHEMEVYRDHTNRVELGQRDIASLAQEAKNIRTSYVAAHKFVEDANNKISIIGASCRLNACTEYMY